MNHMSVYLKNMVLDEKLEGAYVALFNEGGEVAKPSYKRQSGVFAPAVEGQTSNSEEVLFPIAEESWGDIKYVGIFDNAIGGNVLFKSEAEHLKNIDVSGQYKIPKNYLIVRLR